MMADYGARWSYGTTDRRVSSPSPKRARRDYDDLAMVYGANTRLGTGGEMNMYTVDHRNEQSGWGRELDDSNAASDVMRMPYGRMPSDIGLSNALGLDSGALRAGLAAFEDPNLLAQTAQLIGYDISNLGARSVSGNGLDSVDILPPDASSTLFVDGLPSDCSRREAAHIFRPFIGFKEVRLVHKDAKRAVTGDKLILCFVEFVDAKCAATALEALQGYKFDEHDLNSYTLRLTFARYGPRGGSARARSPYRNVGSGRDRSPYRAARRR